MELGLQLFSLRDFIKSREGIIDTFKRAKALGYSSVQFSGASIDANQLCEASEMTDMPIRLTHVATDRILNDTEAVISEHRQFSCKNIGIGSMPKEYRGSIEGTKQFVTDFEKASHKIIDAGMLIHYHNHCFEFEHFDGKRPIDYIIDKAPFFNFTLDTYWVQYAGVDVSDFISRLEGRIKCVHLKDLTVKDFEIKIAPVGEGNMNWTRILSACESIGVDYAFVEQDDAITYPEPWDEVAKSIKYLNNIKGADVLWK